jgi:hypothetical protein
MADKDLTIQDPRSRFMDLGHHEAWHLVRLTPSFAAIGQRLQFANWMVFSMGEIIQRTISMAMASIAKR